MKRRPPSAKKRSASLLPKPTRPPRSSPRALDALLADLQKIYGVALLPGWGDTAAELPARS